MPAYYNEIDPYAAQWLHNLIKAGHIAPGDVDERSIVDVPPDDLRGYEQCHFFAGIGGWSVALRLAGWPDHRPVWTGSCPCQPFSTAGRGEGFADERHLWPYWHYLIEECRPPVVFGEQVEAAIRLGWLDLVQADMEGLGYAFGAAGLPAACVGAPHIRQRLWFVADADGRHASAEREQRSGQQRQQPAHGGSGLVAHADEGRGRGHARAVPGAQGGSEWGLRGEPDGVEPRGAARALADDAEQGRGAQSQRATGADGRPAQEPGRLRDAGAVGDAQRDGLRSGRRAAADQPDESGHWSLLEWLPCRDGKARPTQPGIQPLAHGVPARVGKLRAAGNAIVPQVAAEFIKAYMRCRP